VADTVVCRRAWHRTTCILPHSRRSSTLKTGGKALARGASSALLPGVPGMTLFSRCWRRVPLCAAWLLSLKGAGVRFSASQYLFSGSGERKV